MWEFTLETTKWYTPQIEHPIRKVESRFHPMITRIFMDVWDIGIKKDNEEKEKEKCVDGKNLSYSNNKLYAYVSSVK